jgi:hypothetical protein
MTTASTVTANVPRVASAADASRHSRVENLHVLRLSGDFYEMGRQHGSLLKDEVKDGPVPYYTRMVERLTGKSFGRAAPLLTTLVQRSVGARVGKGLPEFARETLHGIADGAGIDRAEFFRGCTMPDALVWVVSRMAQLRGEGPAVAHRLRLGIGLHQRRGVGQGYRRWKDVSCTQLRLSRRRQLAEARHRFILHAQSRSAIRRIRRCRRGSRGHHRDERGGPLAHGAPAHVHERGEAGWHPGRYRR